MHNSLARVQAAFGYFTTCAFALASIVAFLSIIPYPTPTTQPTASISVRNVQVVKGRPHYYSSKREEYAQIRFDLNADLSSLFTWNTKQVFVYITANYPSIAGGDQSESVIWDMIIPATASPYSFSNLKQTYFPDKKKRTRPNTKAVTKPGQIVLKNQKPKYQITDPSGKLSQIQNATLQVSWNVQPWVGALVWDKGYLGGRVGSWKNAKNGRSAAFTFPPIKGSTSVVKEATQGSKTPEAGSAAPVVDL